MSEGNTGQTEGKEKRKNRTDDQIHQDYQQIVKWRGTSPPKPWREIAALLSEKYGKPISHQCIWAVYWGITGELTEEAKKKALKYHQSTVLYGINEALEAWENSKGKVIKRIVKSKPGNPGKPEGESDDKNKKPDKLIEVQVTEETSHGDPAYLNTLKSFLERYAKLLGQDAPIKIAKTDTEGNDIPEQPAIVVLPSNGRGAPQPPAPTAKAKALNRKTKK